MSTKGIHMHPEEFFMKMFPIDELEEYGIVKDDESDTEIWVMVRPDSGAVAKVVNYAGDIINIPLIEDLHFMRFTSKKRHDALLDIAKAINGKSIDEAMDALESPVLDFNEVKLS